MPSSKNNSIDPPASEVTPLGYPSQLLAPSENLETVTETVGSIVLKPHQRQPVAWFFAAAVAFSLLMIFFIAIAWLLYWGTGIWGINIPVAWGFAIVNFVWWVGIGHAGTFISAVLLLLHQKWRTSINRFTETMTLCAISCAGLFPLLHLGRPWVFFWMLPYPDTMGLWPQFRSPLIWDAFAVGTYFIVSLIFWYSGLIPDLATLRDRATTRGKKLVYGFLALGWRNSAIHWQRHHAAYLLLAGVATPLVLSVHSVVGLDFAVAQLPGWHETIIPPYFVAGAIYSGFAMMLNIILPIRKLYGLQNLITQRHLNNIGNVMLVLEIWWPIATSSRCSWRGIAEIFLLKALWRIASSDPMAGFFGRSSSSTYSSRRLCGHAVSALIQSLFSLSRCQQMSACGWTTFLSSSSA